MHVLAISQGLGADWARWEAVARSGIDSLMIREKQMGVRQLMALGQRLQELDPGLQIWVNGRLDVALSLGAGFHGGEGYPTVPASLCRVSRPLHSPEQLCERSVADQLLISPVFAVPGKGKPLGIKGLHDILDTLPPWGGRVLALGGINHENAFSLKHSRLDGVALMRGLWEASSPRDTVARLRRAWMR